MAELFIQRQASLAGGRRRIEERLREVEEAIALWEERHHRHDADGEDRPLLPAPQIGYDILLVVHAHLKETLNTLGKRSVDYLTD